MGQFAPLKQQLEQLAKHAADIDRQRGEAGKPLFDEQLFRCRARQLVPCVKESQSLITAIEREQDAGVLTTARASHLCDALVNQIEALQREIATLSVRKQEKELKPRWRASIGELYQELARHQDWERQLDDKVRDLETRLGTCNTLAEQQQCQQQLLAQEKRLSRCIEAKRKIEGRIAFREKKG